MSQYGNDAAIGKPASVIYVAESPPGSTGDHFHPMCWGNETLYTPSCTGASFAWDGAKNETSEIALRRHQEGSNYIYVDGHAKWHKWGQVYWQEGVSGVFAGNFDPRQQ